MKHVLLLLALVGGLFAQSPSQVVKSAPDCVLAFAFTGVSVTSQTLDNRTKACSTWTVAYLSNGWATVSLTLQSAPDSSGSPGVWAAFAGPVVSGANPLTSVTYGNSTLSGYVPWLRVVASVTGITGTINGVVMGWATPRPIVTSTGCSTQSAITLTGAGDTEIIAATAGRTVRICELYLAAASAEDVKLTQGTGTNCGTGTADITGLFRQITTLAIPTPNGIRGGVGNAICVNQSGAINSGGLVIYALE